MTILDQTDSIQSYLSDASNLNGNCTEVFLPQSIAEVQEAVLHCVNEGVSLNISGNGTGLVGGRVVQSGKLISLERLQKCTVDTSAMRVSVEAGISMREVQAAVVEAGKLYPPDPTEWSAAMGGTWATNASGARTFKYGPTRVFVHSLRVVLADGHIVDCARGDFVAKGYDLCLRSTSGKEYRVPIPRYKMPSTTKHAAGYYAHENMDAVDLFIGSEGTLGIIVDAQLRIIDQPQRILGMIVFFESYDRLLLAVETLRLNRGSDAPISPRLVEFFDRHALDFISSTYPTIPTQAAGALWIEQEFHNDREDEVFAQWAEFIGSNTSLDELTWFAYDDRKHAEFRAFRHALPSAIYEHISGQQQSKIGTDIAVPPSRFREFFAYYQELFAANDVHYVLFGHIGDAHLHANMFTSSTVSYEKSMELYAELISEGLSLGGTVSAEHGIGKLKKKFLRQMWGDECIDEMRRVKQALDPKGVFSPGNMFD